ncbi:Hypp5957 [Branchiostoma lanceolatum]|uniref:Hypp5957 protein n=1 Tax=Branchiostoma lanceolatum TaxID=7740 RepID=A0A8J9WHA8_BRALA|nr:Hypp5957 [Branchiostoma lanceolatum]
MRQKQAPLRVEDDIESEDITMAAAVSEDFHRESGDGLCGDFSCPHCAFSVDQDVMLKVLKHFFNCTSLQYIIDISVGNAATLGATKPPAPRRASKAPQPHSEPVRHSEPPTKRRATEARATPPQESPRIVTTQAPTLLARLNAAQSRTQTVHAASQREIPSEPEHHTRPVTTRQVETVQPRAPETTTTTTTAATIELPSIPTIKEEPGAGAACIVEPTAPTLFDEPMHTQKDTDSAMGMKRDTDTVGGMLDALPGTSSSGLFSEDLNFGGAGPSFVQSDPSQEDSTSGNVPRFVWNIQPPGHGEPWPTTAANSEAWTGMADMAESGSRKKRGNYATYTPEMRARIAKMCIDIGPQRTAERMSREIGRQLNESTVRYIKNSFNKEVRRLATEERECLTGLGKHPTVHVDGNRVGARGFQDGTSDQVLDSEAWLPETDFRTYYAHYKLDSMNKKLDQTLSYIQPICSGLWVQNPSSDGRQAIVPPVVPPSPMPKTYNKPTDDTILIGDPTSGKTYPMNFTDYESSLAKASSGRVFLLKLMEFVYSDDELKESNFRGGSILSKGVKKYRQPLSKDKMSAIVYQTRMEFEGFEVSKHVVEAINTKCRHKRFKTFKE